MRGALFILSYAVIRLLNPRFSRMSGGLNRRRCTLRKKARKNPHLLLKMN